MQPMSGSGGPSPWTWQSFQRAIGALGPNLAQEIERQQDTFFAEKAMFDEEEVHERGVFEQNLARRARSSAPSSPSSPFSPLTTGPTASMRDVVRAQLHIEEEKLFEAEQEKYRAEFMAGAEKKFPLATVTEEAEMTLKYGLPALLQRNLFRTALARRQLLEEGLPATPAAVLKRVSDGVVMTTGDGARTPPTSGVLDGEEAGVAPQPQAGGRGSCKREAVDGEGTTPADPAAEAIAASAAASKGVKTEHAGEHDGRTPDSDGANAARETEQKRRTLQRMEDMVVTRGVVLSPAPEPVVEERGTALYYPSRWNTPNAQHSQARAAAECGARAESARLGNHSQPPTSTTASQRGRSDPDVTASPPSHLDAFVAQALAVENAQQLRRFAARALFLKDRIRDLKGKAPAKARAGAERSNDPQAADAVAATRALEEQLEEVTEAQAAWASAQRARAAALRNEFLPTLAKALEAGAGTDGDREAETLVGQAAESRGSPGLGQGRDATGDSCRVRVPVPTAAAPTITLPQARRVLEAVAQLTTTTCGGVSREVSSNDERQQRQQLDRAKPTGAAGERAGPPPHASQPQPSQEWGTFALPDETADSDALLERQYMWPTALDESITHELQAITNTRGSAATAWHPRMLSAMDLGDLFACACLHDQRQQRNVTGTTAADEDSNSNSNHATGGSDSSRETAGQAMNRVLRDCYAVVARSSSDYMEEKMGVRRIDGRRVRETPEDATETNAYQIAIEAGRRRAPAAPVESKGVPTEGTQAATLMAERRGGKRGRGDDEDEDAFLYSSVARGYEGATTLQFAKRYAQRRLTYVELPGGGNAALLDVDGAGQFAASHVVLTSNFAAAPRK